MKITFVDVEASSLNADSFPIELAWVDRHGQGESYLIRPEPEWTDWSERSEAVHGISRAVLLRDGRPALWVAHRAHAMLDGHLTISDNPRYDAQWLSKLYKLAGYPEIRLHSLHFVAGTEIARILALNVAEPDSPAYWRQARLLLDAAQNLVAQTTETAIMQLTHRHRALSDATDLWRIWLAVRTAMVDRLRVPTPGTLSVADDWCAD